MSIRADYTASVLSSFVTTGLQPPTGAPKSKSKYTEQEKTERAIKLRTAMHAIIDRGEQPKGPKADWIRASAGHVLELLGEIAEQYNAEHDDAAIVGDMLDILATAKGHFNE